MAVQKRMTAHMGPTRPFQVYLKGKFKEVFPYLFQRAAAMAVQKRMTAHMGPTTPLLGVFEQSEHYDCQTTARDGRFEEGKTAQQVAVGSEGFVGCDFFRKTIGGCTSAQRRHAKRSWGPAKPKGTHCGM